MDVVSSVLTQYSNVVLHSGIHDSKISINIEIIVLRKYRWRGYHEIIYSNFIFYLNVVLPSGPHGVEIHKKKNKIIVFYKM